MRNELLVAAFVTLLLTNINPLDIGSAMNAKSAAVPSLTYLIKWMERKVRSELETALLPLGVSVSEYTALSVLNEGRELSSSQLARRTFVSAQAMHPIVTDLIKRKLLARRDNPDHGRIQLVRLTAQGQRLLDRCNAASRDAEERAFAGLSPAQTAALRKSLERCVRTISEKSPTA
jgi:DNA-binding MarR family transcriptional regulator